MIDSKHIDSVENALEVGIELVRHLPEPLEKETSEKLNEIADCLNLLADFEKSHGIIVSFKCTYGFSLLPLNEFGLCLSEVGLFS